MRLVKDIVPGEGGSRVWAITPVGDFAYFVADDHTHGLELWKRTYASEVSRHYAPSGRKAS